MIDYEIPGLPLSLRVPPENHTAHAGRRLLVSLAPPPVGEPCLLKAANGLVAALELTLQMLGEVKPEVKECLESLNKLSAQLTDRPATQATVEVDAALSGTKTRHPEWWVLTRHKLLRKAGCTAQLFIGCAALVSMSQGRRLTRGMCATAEDLLNLDLTPHQLKVLLRGEDPGQAAGEAWPRQLRRLWVQAMKLYSTDPNLPPSSLSDRIASQILDGALAPTARKRGGAATHRQLSKGQLLQFQTWSQTHLQTGTLEGTYAVLVCLTGFSVDLVAELELMTEPQFRLPVGSSAGLDLDQGTLKIDYSLVIHDAANALAGALPAGTVISKPMPAVLIQQLRNRSRQYPLARQIKDLFPGEPVPKGQDPLWPSHSAMPATWARLRRTFGTWLRSRGVNNLTAAILTGDFDHIPRSKLYYARVGSPELEKAFLLWFKGLGWGAPSSNTNRVGFGCQAVHPNHLISLHDQHLREEMDRVLPGKHCHLDRLLEHHNRFMRICGFRLSLLLALRETTALEILADVDEGRQRWWAIGDKLTPNSTGASQQPISAFIRQTLHAIRLHCSTLTKRLNQAGHAHSSASKWAQSVARRQDVRLLCHIENVDAIRPLATRDFLNSAAPQVYRLAPDFGRKALENLSRELGLKGSETDALVRHNVSGQNRLTSTGHTCPSDFHVTATHTLDVISTQLFSQVAYGLSKGAHS